MVTMVTMVTVSRCCNEYFISVKYYGESSSQFQNFNFLKAVPLRCLVVNTQITTNACNYSRTV